MTTQADPQGAPEKIGADKIILGLLAVLLIGVLVFLSSQRQTALRNSATGLDGLQVWLAKDALDVQNFTGGWRLDANEIGLQIVPLYDTLLNSPRPSPANTEEIIMQQDEFDLQTRVISGKAELAPMLLVLPKWRSGVRLTQRVHPALLVDEGRLSAVINSLIEGSGARARQTKTDFVPFDYDIIDGGRHQVITYAAQTFSAAQCEPLLGTAEAMLMGVCPLRGGNGQVFILSDPDVLNNHGLQWGDNAFFIRDWVRSVAGDQRVLIDYSRQNWLAEEVYNVSRERTWADLRRFFSPPFTLMWVGLALGVLLLLWRSAMRFGPVEHGPGTMSASKKLAIAARARLMRLSGRDGALADEYCKARLAATATGLFGAAHARQFARPEAFLAFVKRRHPQHARPLTEALNTIQSLPPGATAAQAMASIADFDRILELIKHDT